MINCLFLTVRGVFRGGRAVRGDVGVDLRTGSGSRGGIRVMDHILYFYNYVHIFIVHRDFDNSDCLTLPRVVLL